MDGGSMVRLLADGLSSDHKIALEAYLTQSSQNYGTVLIYYRNSENETRARPAPVAAPATQTGPFGVKMNKQAIPGVKRVIAVSSGKGGVGKSTVSANLAVSLARKGHKVGLLDADIYGPSAPLMLGIEGSQPVGSGGKIEPVEAHGVKCVSFGLMSSGSSPVIWRGPMVSRALQQLFYQTEWGELDYLVLDLPPGTGDVQLTMIEKLPLQSAIIVTTPQNVALLDAEKGLSMFQKLKVPILGIVENMSYHVCSNCGFEDYIFGNEAEGFADRTRQPLLARIPLMTSIRAGGDTGRPASLERQDLAKIYEGLVKRIENDVHQ
ncbi:MAG: Mrp/NBP35 family ATP-binding protein [Pseudobacteriovorax sp.]|nr:Mrp/NBP35 family ATP-binding protein [Pseudobacteriovorax sp.]